MPKESDYMFSVDTLASYLYSLKNNISPLKLQKSLYFLFAYHGALYTQETGEGVFEGTSVAPKYLFNAQFEAWQYGPVIRQVYNNDKRGIYSSPDMIEAATKEVESEPEVKKFIDELFMQIDSVSDFKLVDRSHQDDSWKEAYSQGQSTLMDNEQIIQEYQEKYV
ncbi:Panacea domain-containing protein [Paenibacillus lactis]|uniref:Panacea domain-containing protein n=1 Tax=Paenibacillus lactis TaxID=228574 RepID=UPI003D72FDE9